MNRLLLTSIAWTCLSFACRDKNTLATPPTVEQLVTCESYGCLRAKLPYDLKPPIAPELCDPLRGKISEGGENLDMGLLCTLLVARNQATFRADAPCPDEDDFHRLLGLEPANVPVVGYLLNPTIHESELEGFSHSRSEQTAPKLRTLIHERRQLSKSLDGRRDVLDRVAFCVTKNPQPIYVAYFHSLEVDGKVSSAEGVESLLTQYPVLGQLQELERPDPGTPFLIEDIDSSGEDDVLFPSRKRGLWGLSACLHNAAGGACTLRRSATTYEGGAFLTPRLDKRGQNVQLTQVDENNPQENGSVTYQFTAKGFKVVSSEGNLKLREEKQ